jgi:ABC-type sugar transport system ATPase subunit
VREEAMAEIRLVGVTKKFGENIAVDHIDLTATKSLLFLLGLPDAAKQPPCG